MRILTLLFLIIVLIQSCKSKQDKIGSFKSLLQNCDLVDIIYYNGTDTLIYHASDTSEIQVLTKLISVTNETIGDSCKPSGQLQYKKAGQTIIIAEFSTSNSNDSVSCDYITYSLRHDNYKHRLTYNAGMFIDEVLWKKLKWSSVDFPLDSITLNKDSAKVIIGR